MKRILLNTTAILSLAAITFCYAQPAQPPMPDAVVPGVTVVNLKIEVPASMAAKAMAAHEARFVIINGTEHKFMAGQSTASIKTELTPQKVKAFRVAFRTTPYGEVSCPIVWHEEMTGMHKGHSMYTVKDITVVLEEHKVDGKAKISCKKAVITAAAAAKKA